MGRRFLPQWARPLFFSFMYLFMSRSFTWGHSPGSTFEELGETWVHFPTPPSMVVALGTEKNRAE